MQLLFVVLSGNGETAMVKCPGKDGGIYLSSDDCYEIELSKDLLIECLVFIYPGMLSIKDPIHLIHRRFNFSFENSEILDRISAYTLNDENSIGGRGWMKLHVDWRG